MNEPIDGKATEPADTSLLGRRILVTRPAAQAEALCAEIERRGGTALRLPLLSVEAVGDTALQRLAANTEADWWIFTSSNAVRFAAQAEGLAWPAQIAAVGAATAHALESAGHPVQAVPSHSYSSAALLELPPMQAVSGSRVVIVTGEEGLPTLADSLRARGAKVEVVPVYRRVRVPYGEAEIAAAIERSDLLILTSGDALQHLLESIQNDAVRARLLRLPVVVPSVRVLELATAAGFEREPILPNSMSDAALVQALERWGAPTEPAPQSPMTEPNPIPEKPITSPPPPASQSRAPAPAAPAGRRGVLGFFVGLAWLVLLLLTAVVAYGGWMAWQFREQALDALDAQQTLLSRTSRDATGAGAELRQLETRQGDLGQTQRKFGSELETMRQRFDDSEKMLAEISESVRGGRTDLQLVAVEQLLFIANERLQLARDVPGAARALDLADRRLAVLADPRLFKVREAIAAEKRALASLPAADRASAALALSSLIVQVPNLPLARSRPDNYQVGSPADVGTAQDMPWWRVAWHRMGLALSTVFTLRRSDAPIEPLLAPEQRELVQTILLLKLEATRAALLGGNTGQFRESLTSAIDWLRARYALSDPAVASAVDELQAQQQLELEPPLPDLTSSLTALRGVMEAPSPRQ
ncbi:uroporphyrinogen-III C-methyltransferase [Algiphilus sp. W345]|uniref:Uroporphyrinogen-III C-methyltransferase n=1 Tax=Banduia mediterranea TaxID=3075609 RepID=A0ABU2WIX0_9GAMM|nr:uroporphyrinogen-III C-methyltransferase [Algiphilus sp. W345]MDT0497813.1 uroporphyrinogen-III C-methyltransferase [Algiphilus sp. W345]